MLWRNGVDGWAQGYTWSAKLQQERSLAANRKGWGGDPAGILYSVIYSGEGLTWDGRCGGGHGNLGLHDPSPEGKGWTRLAWL